MFSVTAIARRAWKRPRRRSSLAAISTSLPEPARESKSNTIKATARSGSPGGEPASPDELTVLRAAFELMPQPVLVVDLHEDRILDVNPASIQVLGMSREKLIGAAWTSIAQNLQEVVSTDVDGNGRRYVAIATNSEWSLPGSRELPRDSLTGLATREVLVDRFSQSDSACDPTSALLFIDLDGFKLVNDSFGHLVGDQVLRVIAERLAESVRPSDLVVRYGGDEFVVLVQQVRRRRYLERLGRRIASVVQMPVLVEGRRLILSASVGIAHRNGETVSLDTLIAQADREMYLAKALRRGQSVAYRSPAALAPVD